MEILVEPEELISCPYNNAHHIRKKKMAFHLVKCKKNYPNSKMVTCDFNVTHMIPEPEIQYHHERCPNRKDLEIMIYRESGEEINKYPVQNIPVETDEIWDDCYTSTYDPKEYCEKTNIIRKLDGESSANRKKFQMMERNRLSQFSEKIFKHKPVEEEDTPVNKKPTKFRKPVFPQVSRNQREISPDVIAALVERIKQGAKKSFNMTNKQ